MSQNNPSPIGKGAGIGLGALLLSLPIVAYFEGYIPKTYVDPVGIPTVCFGETDKSITMQARVVEFTKDQCYVLLGASLHKHAAAVAPCIKVPIADHEAAAILSWSYNVGPVAACKSTLISKLNSGRPPREWCAELYRWVYAGDKKLKGLELRREAEHKMCMGEK